MTDEQWHRAWQRFNNLSARGRTLFFRLQMRKTRPVEF